MKITSKTYKCKVCGHKVEQETNHYGETYSLGNYNQCEKCPRYKPLPKNWDKDYDLLIPNTTTWVYDSEVEN